MARATAMPWATLSAIASTCAESDGVGFKHSDIKTGISLMQVIGSPQSRETCTNDRDIDVLR